MGKLGHELTHVVQQREGRVQPTKQGKGKAVNDNPSLESEADNMGKKAANGQQVDVAGKGSGVQKKGGEEEPASKPGNLDFGGYYKGLPVYFGKSLTDWFPVLQNLSKTVVWKKNYKEYSYYQFYLKGFLLCALDKTGPRFNGKKFAAPNNSEITILLNAFFHPDANLHLPQPGGPMPTAFANAFDKVFQEFLIVYQNLLYLDMANNIEFIDSKDNDENKTKGIENLIGNAGAMVEPRGDKYREIMIDGAAASAFKGLEYYAIAYKLQQAQGDDTVSADYYLDMGDALFTNAGFAVYDLLHERHFANPDISLAMTIFNTALSIVPIPGASQISTIVKSVCRKIFKDMMVAAYSNSKDPAALKHALRSNFTEAAMEMFKNGKIDRELKNTAISLFLSSSAK
jgi:hypothetical protein